MTGSFSFDGAIFFAEMNFLERVLQAVVDGVPPVAAVTCNMNGQRGLPSLCRTLTKEIVARDLTY